MIRKQFPEVFLNKKPTQAGKGVINDILVKTLKETKASSSHCWILHYKQPGSVLSTLGNTVEKVCCNRMIISLY